MSRHLHLIKPNSGYSHDRLTDFILREFGISFIKRPGYQWLYRALRSRLKQEQSH